MGSEKTAPPLAVVQFANSFLTLFAIVIGAMFYPGTPLISGSLFNGSGVGVGFVRNPCWPVP